MTSASYRLRVGPKLLLLAFAALLCSGTPHAQEKSGATAEDQPSAKDDKPSEQSLAKLRIQVKGNNGKPVANASVYVRYNKPGGFLHKDKLAELDLKTNGEGTVKVPPVPQGNVLIQVIAPGWHTYGRWYEINKDEQSIDIQLDPPTHWY